MQVSREKMSPTGLCSLLLCLALVPGMSAGYVFLQTGYVHEGVGAAYFLPAIMLAAPTLIVAAKCFERAGEYGTRQFALVLGSIVLSAMVLVAPYLAMRSL